MERGSQYPCVFLNACSKNVRYWFLFFLPNISLEDHICSTEVLSNLIAFRLLGAWKDFLPSEPITKTSASFECVRSDTAGNHNAACQSSSYLQPSLSQQRYSDSIRR